MRKLKGIKNWVTRPFKKKSVLPRNEAAIIEPFDSEAPREVRPGEGIPKTIHIVWIGDESKCPSQMIDTWRKQNPDFTVRVWGNRELQAGRWYNKKHIQALWDKECFHGIADIMRFEILYWYGGFAVDADSICRRPLALWLFHCEAFACWDNELERPALIASGYVASVPRNEFLRTIILSIAEDPRVVSGLPWKYTGPGRLTDVYQESKYSRLVIYPSYFFIPNHHSGRSYDGDMTNVLAEQFWGTTNNSYDLLYKMRVTA